MKIGTLGMARILRIASAFIVIGLVVEIISLAWDHPLSFALFAFVGASLIGLGILIYLASLVLVVSPPDEPRR
ncbi:MAG TPA: hypothetical protein VEJ45_07580 [Candidatus Acidoferrales bacterium]|nr:hypothetical protein [Candidatus Acidoferrales bacterium]